MFGCPGVNQRNGFFLVARDSVLFIALKIAKAQSIFGRRDHPSPPSAEVARRMQSRSKEWRAAGEALSDFGG